MTKKKTTTKKSEKPVGVTMFFEENALVVKLTKRVPGPNYKRAQDIIESTLLRVFGSGFTHRRGSTTSTIKGATVDQANHVSAGLGLHDDVISLVYNMPEEVDVPTPKKAGHSAAIAALKSEVESLDRNIKTNRDDIERWKHQMDKAQDFFDANIERRAELIATIKALKA